MEVERRPRLVILPSPGMGHLIPLLEFAKRLVSHHHFSVTFLIPIHGPSSSGYNFVLKSLPPTITHVFLPPANLEDVDLEATRVETIISLTVARSLPAIRDFFKASVLSGHKPLALVVDIFGTDAFDAALEFDVSPYVFFCSSTMTLSLFLHLPTLDQEVSCEYRDLPELVKIPGSIPIHGKYLLDPVQDRKDEAYSWVLHHTKRYKLAEGILENSFAELEPGTIKYLTQPDLGLPPVYPVGPLINMDSDKNSSDPCLKWLDDQPPGSVLFVSFGSGGTLSSDQMNELAHGLEMSEHRFLWVVRSPSVTAANAAYFDSKSKDDPVNFLPKGFIERTKTRGMVIPSWAPQSKVLSHGSTGGFLSHCGWNSTLESVCNGVPMISWPLYAEQKMNAVLLSEDVKVALRPRAGENGIVGREEIARVVRGLIEGEEGKKLRGRVKSLKDAAARNLSEDGSSTKALSDFIFKLKSKIQKI